VAFRDAYPLSPLPLRSTWPGEIASSCSSASSEVRASFRTAAKRSGGNAMAHKYAARPRNRVAEEQAIPALGGSTMNYLLSVLIIAVVASQAIMWHSLAPIRSAIQQTNAIILAAVGRAASNAGGSWFYSG
jgi:hypothetical protein